MNFFDIRHIAFEILGYPISYVELTGTLFGLISVYLASKAQILTWATGIINELFLFMLFFQVQLYADMFLQVYFFIVTIFGWYNWKQKPGQHSIGKAGFKARAVIIIAAITGTLATGFIFSNIHAYLPEYFPTAATYPFADSFVLVLSIIATILLAQKKIETWYLWIVVDLVCVCLFYKKGIIFLALEYVVFLGLATYGLRNWRKELRHG